ncbi:hypothetical protein K466DRAFT_615981 [Polyporus arcularius HHB13444]|uniref:Uncharacterized protein n=1 Tax=Polyporus arcularius HHB13444 TaxID=1314778 RepID=A0A5C3PDB3_9APHY|nr:hypothetical protein K466DRAFT_615981 [Polyporus arcularius HHB13444]
MLRLAALGCILRSGVVKGATCPLLLNVDEGFAAPASLLNSEDRATLAFVSSSKVQGWTVAKIEDYTNRIHALKVVHPSIANFLQAFIKARAVFSQLKPGWRPASVLHTSSGLDGTYLIGVNERSMARLIHFLDLTRTRLSDLSVIGLPHNSRGGGELKGSPDAAKLHGGRAAAPDPSVPHAAPVKRTICSIDSYSTYMLSPCPALETLDHSNLCLRDVPLDGGDNATYLPFLRRLVLSDEPPLMSVLLANLSFPKNRHVNICRITRQFDDMLPEDCTFFHPLPLADEVVVDFDSEEAATLQTYRQGSQLLRMRSSGLGPSSNPFFQLVCQIRDLFEHSRAVFALTLRSAPPLADTIGGYAVGLRALLSAFPALSAFCNAIVGILKRQEGLALPLPMLSITVLPGEGGYKPSWTALVEREKVRLREGLTTKLVQDIAVSYVADAP